MMFRKDATGTVLVNLENMDDVFLNCPGGKVLASKGEASYMLFKGTPEEAVEFFNNLATRLEGDVSRETGGVPESGS